MMQFSKVSRLLLFTFNKNLDSQTIKQCIKIGNVKPENSEKFLNVC